MIAGIGNPMVRMDPSTHHAMATPVVLWKIFGKRNIHATNSHNTSSRQYILGRGSVFFAASIQIPVNISAASKHLC
jgi:hypothetical protein